jgi:excinuclease ABC subunit A
MKDTLTENNVIRLRGVSQHNLKNIDLDLPLFKLTAISGVSGSGKSSLALHTLYAEGQRRYIETFSPYARQFLERMDPPKADLIDGIPPSIAIESGTSVRSSRSTVGTITEINDHLKLLFARLATAYCPTCGRPITEDTPESIFKGLSDLPPDSRVLITFPYAPDPSGDWVRHLVSQGFLRLYSDGKTMDLESIDRQAIASREDRELLVVVDRIAWGKATPERVTDSLATAFSMGKGRLVVVVLPDVVRRFSAERSCPDCNPAAVIPAPTSNLFSFNSPLGACPECRGFGRTIGVDLDLVIPDRKLSLSQGAIKPWGTDRTEYEDLMAFCGKAGIPVDVPFEELDEAARQKIINGTGKYYGIMGFFEWLETRTYRMHVRVFLSRYRAYVPCKACGGTRYQPATALYRLRGVTIGELSSWSIERCSAFFGESWPELDQDPAAALLVNEIRSRLEFLGAVGLEYLTLDRQSRTLSGGEVQRVHLTRALGSALVNVLYVLDEPSVGLHARDQKRLMGQLYRLVGLGNSVVVVEHDPDMIRFCDNVVDLGPGGGEKGGEIIFHGPPKGLAQCEKSLTGGYLSGRLEISAPAKRRVPDLERALVLKGARENNLKNLTVRFPLGLLIGVSGVSGSGKSTLIEKTLYNGWLRALGRSTESPGECDGIEGVEHIDEIVMVDQQPVGRTPRANLLTYTHALDPIRKLLAQTPEAVAHGYTTRQFSFNVPGGRCEVCKGEGYEHVEMQFLADVYIRCPQCGGRRFKDEVLDVRIRGLSIADMLDCTAKELRDKFIEHDAVVKALEPLVVIGLDYLRLGQPLSSLSGGEAQRLKLVRYLTPNNGRSGGARGHRLFLLDEPTTGLHPHDLQKLLNVLQKLVNLGNTVLVVEHNLDLLKACDWLIDLGPEGGERGGEIVAAGPPEEIAANPESRTGRYLLQRLNGGAAPLDGEPADDDAIDIRNSSGFSGGDKPRPYAAGQSIAVGAGFIPARMEGSNHSIVVRGAHEHNLHLDEIQLPLEQMTVLTGLSGSGKSTLAFDVLFAEGQRRYLECLSTYVRQYFKILEKPDVDQILGLSPTVAIEQRTSQLNRRSTVATITEIYHFLRLLYAKLGRQHCPSCGRELEALSFEQILAMVEKEVRKGKAKLLAPLVRGRKGIYRDLFLRLKKMGFDTVRVDGIWYSLKNPPVLARHREHDIEVVVPGLRRGDIAQGLLAEKVRQALGMGGGSLLLDGDEPRVLSEHLYCHNCQLGLAPLDPRLFSFNSRHGSCPTCMGIGTAKQLNIEALLGALDVPLKEGLLPLLRNTAWRGKGRAGARRSGRTEKQWLEGLGLNPDLSLGELDSETREAMLKGGKGKSAGLVSLLERMTENDTGWSAVAPFFTDAPCPECKGRRLNAQARSVYFREWPIGELVRLSISDFEKAWRKLRFNARESLIAGPISKEITERLAFLNEVGLDYLSLDRSGDTLSGGESQRIRLAAQLGSNLRGVCYILDEPTIGLHPTDNMRLLDSLRRLKEKGNTIIIVEHDTETMRQADTLIELGPGAGRAGGELVARGSFSSLCRDPHTLTGQWFGKEIHEVLEIRDRKEPGAGGWLEITGAKARNLKNIRARIPLGALTCITGVSGAGKSTLVHEVVYRGLLERVGKRDGKYSARIDGMKGHEALQRVLEVDHNPIGRTPRSIPATYVGVWDEIRKLFAMLPEAKARGFLPGRFSFNVKGGRCETCKGQGQIRVEMNFLPNVHVPCETCRGSRFNAETLAVSFKGKTIADVLNMTVDEAAQLFIAFPKIAMPLKVLNDLGLGYLTLGQASPTLSGGEAQRIKLAGELGNHRGATLYILDEPTTGLHRADVKRLLDVLHALTGFGHTVLVIEHNMDFVWASDYVLDVGPGSGDAGGRIVAEGSPVELVGQAERSLTARSLREYQAVEQVACQSGE